MNGRSHLKKNECQDIDTGHFRVILFIFLFLVGSPFTNRIFTHHIQYTIYIIKYIITLFEPPHGKTNNLHMRKQRRRSASR